MDLKHFVGRKEERNEKASAKKSWKRNEKPL